MIFTYLVSRFVSRGSSYMSTSRWIIRQMLSNATAELTIGIKKKRKMSK